MKLLAALLLVSGLALGAIALTSGTAGATAAVSTNELEVAGAKYSADGASVYSPWLYVDGTASFDVDSTPESWTVALQVAPADSGDYETIATASDDAISSAMAFGFETKGRLIDHSAYNESDFAPDRNATVRHALDVRLVLTVEAADGSTVVTANATDSTVVVVENTLGELSARLDGSGYVLFQESESDGAPTPTATPAGS